LGAFGEFSTMQDRMNLMNRLFRESYSPEGPEEAWTTTSFAPPVDIYENEHNITLKIEVPGIDDKDIDVRIENNMLTLHGERKIEKEEKEENFRRVERQYGGFPRSFTLPSSVDPGQVSADYDKGVLKINLRQEGRSQAQADQGQCPRREDPRSQGSQQGCVKPVASERKWAQSALRVL
jgi:HSP20 family protein